MTNEFQVSDPHNVWQNQPTEAFKMSADTLRCKARQLDRRSRRAVLISTVIAMVLFLWFGWGFFSFQKFQRFDLGPLGEWTARVGFAVLSLWALYSGYKTYKVFWPNPAASDADLKTTLQAYRERLEKRLHYSQNIWLRSGLIFCFLGMTMVVAPIVTQDLATSPRLLVNVAPICVLFILWLAIFIPQRKRRQRRLQEEIDHLRSFEAECRA